MKYSQGGVRTPWDLQLGHTPCTRENQPRLALRHRRGLFAHFVCSYAPQVVNNAYEQSNALPVQTAPSKRHRAHSIITACIRTLYDILAIKAVAAWGLLVIATRQEEEEQDREDKKDNTIGYHGSGDELE